VSITSLAQIECGTHHTAALTTRGELYTWGMGACGALGHGGRRSEPVPRLVTALSQFAVVRVACGSHTLALTQGGALYAWGDCKHGQLGLGTRQAGDSPRIVQSLAGVRVVGLAVGEHRSLALTADDETYVWGGDDAANGTAERQTLPLRVGALLGRGLVFAAIGASHSVLLVAPGGGALAR